MDIGAYIKNLRQSSGLTQEDLGKLVGVQRAAVQKWESGMTQNLKRNTIQKLAEIFDVNPASFINDKPVKNNVDTELRDVYLSLARNAQENGILPEDIETAIEMIKKLRGRE